MKPFDYVSVLISIVLSLALAHVLASAAHMIQYGVRRASALLAFWMLFVVYMAVDFWLSLWQLHDQIGWSLPFIVFLLVQVSVIYIAARLATPDPEPREAVDMAGYFEATRRRLFEVLGGYMLFAFAANQMIPGFGTLELTVLILAYAVIFFVGSRLNSWIAHRLIAATITGVTTYYCVRYLAGI